MATDIDHMLDILQHAKRGDPIEYRVKASSSKHGPKNWTRVCNDDIRHGYFHFDFQAEEFRVVPQPRTVYLKFGSHGQVIRIAYGPFTEGFGYHKFVEELDP